MGKSRRIFLGTGTVPKTSARRTTELLQLRVCKAIAARALKEHDPTARVRFCNQIRKSVHDAKVDPHLVLFFDEACFSLPGKENSQNNRYWSAENPGFIHKLPLLDQKNWCLVCDEHTP